MKNKFSVKIVLTANNVTKVFNPDKEFRKHVVVTADGLPYKVMIDLIKMLILVQCVERNLLT